MKDLAQRLERLVWAGCDCVQCDGLSQAVAHIQVLENEKQRLQAALQEIDEILEHALTKGCDPVLVGRASTRARRALGET
jgi:hypothetical protein